MRCRDSSPWSYWLYELHIARLSVGTAHGDARDRSGFAGEQSPGHNRNAARGRGEGVALLEASGPGCHALAVDRKDLVAPYAPDGRLLNHPAVPSAGPLDAHFAQPDRLEFQAGDLDGAIRLLWSLARSRDERARAEALLRLGRVHWKRKEARVLQADFISAVSHEFRSPLTTLGHMTELLADDRAADEPTRRLYLGFMQSETSRLRRLVENLLDFGGMQATRRQYEREHSTSSSWCAKRSENTRRRFRAADTRSSSQPTRGVGGGGSRSPSPGNSQSAGERRQVFAGVPDGMDRDRAAMALQRGNQMPSWL